MRIMENEMETTICFFSKQQALEERRKGIKRVPIRDCSWVVLKCSPAMLEAEFGKTAGCCASGGTPSQAWNKLKMGSLGNGKEYAN